MTRSITVRGVQELVPYKNAVRDNLDKSLCQLRQIAAGDSGGIEVFRKLKFQKCMTEPLTGEAENLIEVINQSMTYIVSLMGVEYLYTIYKDKIFHLNMGRANGPDIYSEDGEVVCEGFAAVSASNNRKLHKDRDRLVRAEASHKYLFYYDGQPAKTEDYMGVRVVRFGELRL